MREPEIHAGTRKWRNRALLFSKGMAMGAADSIPGVSGGTIAFITNIYEELIYSIQRINPHALNILLNSGVRVCWHHINGDFLLTLGLGILLSLKLFAGIVLYLLAEFQSQLLAFFCGLILASSLYMANQIKQWRLSSVSLLLSGAVLSVGLALLPQTGGDTGLLYLFFCGALAICAMILPGISGAFILILLGAYERVLTALNNLEFITIAVFAAGCAFGLMAFSQLLAYLFRHFHDAILSFLLGILLGSLYSIWPWKVPDTSVTGAGDTAAAGSWENISPMRYSELSGQDADILTAAVLLITGFVLVLGLEKVAGRKKE